MGISYIATLPELMVLAYFCGIHRLRGFPEIPPLEESETGEILAALSDKGMVTLRHGEVVVEPVMRLIVKTAAQPELSIHCAQGGAFCGVTPVLGVFVRPDAYMRRRYVLTPVETADELAELMMDAGLSGQTEQEFVVWGGEEPGELGAYGQNSLRQRIARVYKYVTEEE